MKALVEFEMPETCCDCPCFDSDQCYCHLIGKEPESPEKRKPLSCPLVESDGYILLGRDYWMKHFNLYTQTWTTDDGAVSQDSFRIERKKE